MPYSPEDQQWIKGQLQAESIGRKIVIHDSVTSTNDLAKHLMSQPDNEGMVILADRQTQGKGRQDRTWHSEDNVGIYLSVILRPALTPEQMAPITLVGGVAVVQAINEFSRARATLKWPNDVFLNDKKVAGILTENCPDSAYPGIVLGIGVNVNNAHFPVPLQHIATSMAMENGEIFERLPLITFLLNHLNQEYQSFLNEGMAPIVEQWNQNSDMFGRSVSLTQKNQTIYGTAMKLNEEGHLVLMLDDGEEVAFDSGEVALIG